MQVALGIWDLDARGKMFVDQVIQIASEAAQSMPVEFLQRSLR